MAEQFPSETLREIADRARLALGADRALVLPLAGGDPLPPGPEGGPSLSAPIRIDGDPVATLVVSRDPGGAPFGEESGLLSTVCDLAAHAIAASRRADLRTEQLALVQAVASAVSAATAVDEAFRMAATVVFEHTRYSGVTATMVDRAAKQQLVVVDLGGDIATTQPIRRDLEAGLVGACIREATQLVLAEATADPRYSWSADGRWESLLLTPVMVEGRCEGVLELADSEPNRFDAADAALMQVAADQVATALVGVRLRERSTRLQTSRSGGRSDWSWHRTSRARSPPPAAWRSSCAPSRSPSIAIPTTPRCGRPWPTTARGPSECGRSRGAATRSRCRRTRSTRASSGRSCDGAQALLGRSHLADAGGAWAAAGYESLLATPVMIDRRCEAVIGLSDLRADQFDDSDALLMRTLAEQVAAALRGAALREESDRRATRLNVVAEVARALRAPETVEQALHDAAQAISRYTRLLRAHRLARGARLGRAPGGLCARPRHRCLHPGCASPPAPASRERRSPPARCCASAGPVTTPPSLAGPRPEQLRPDRPRDGAGRLCGGACDLGRAPQLVRQRRRGAGQGDRRPHRRRNPRGAAARGVGSARAAAVAGGRYRRPAGRRADARRRLARGGGGRARARTLRRGHGDHGARGDLESSWWWPTWAPTGMVSPGCGGRSARGSPPAPSPRAARTSSTGTRTTRPTPPGGTRSRSTSCSRHRSCSTAAAWRCSRSRAGRCRPVRPLRRGADDRGCRAARRSPARRAPAPPSRSGGRNGWPSPHPSRPPSPRPTPLGPCSVPPWMPSSSRPTTARSRPSWRCRTRSEHLVVTDRVRVGASIEGSRRPIHHGAAGRALATGEQIVVGAAHRARRAGRAARPPVGARDTGVRRRRPRRRWRCTTTVPTGSTPPTPP